LQLAIDIGNTNTKIGLFENNKLVKVYVNTDNLIEVLEENKPITHAIIARSGKENAIVDFLEQNGVSILHMKNRPHLPIHIAYKTPDTLGADRIAGSVEASAMFPNCPVLKIDAGTCVTFDFVNEKRQFEGGAISPGLSLRFKALHEYTAKLPLVTPSKLSSYELIGNDTTSAILSGVINGINAEVLGIIKQYKQRYSGLKVVATGGDWPMFATMKESEIFVRPNLVLEGLNRILNFNINSEK
jgi:type III pantothenate kinase